MKQIISFLCCILFLTNCSNPKNNPIANQQKANKIINSMKPGHIAVSATGFYMTAKVDGKDWAAASIEHSWLLHVSYKRKIFK
jgi:PBP1b-binding outer membrane lipoprotein LpoB